MAARKQGDQHLTHRLLLTHDGLAQLTLDLSRALDKIGDSRAIELRVGSQIGHQWVASAYPGLHVRKERTARP